MNDRRLFAFAATALICTAPLSIGAPPEANASLPFQGRLDLTAGGSYSGTTWFKFRMLGGNGDGLWGNDGSAGTNEPPTAVTNFVSGGLFNVVLGESPMAPLPPMALHHHNPHLRTWVSTNGIDFEMLGEDINLDPINLSQLDTGGTIFVDDDGQGDFTTIQEAIDHVATNEFDVSGLIMVMPGYYDLDAPLIFPDGITVNMRGLGTHNDAYISNTNGAAAIVSGWNNIFENLTISGSPAISDIYSISNYHVLVKQCELSCIDGPGHGAIQIESSSGRFDLWHSIVNSQVSNGGSAAWLTGDVNFGAIHTEFGVWDGDSPTVALTNFTGDVILESCSLHSDTGPAFSATDTIGGRSWKFKSVEFEGPVRIDNRNFSYNCEFIRCGFRSNGDSAVYVKDNLSQIGFHQCEVHAQSGHGIEFILSADAAFNSWLNIIGSTIGVIGGGLHDGLNLSGNATNENSGLNVELRETSVWGYDARDGIHFSTATDEGDNQVSLFGCEIEGQRHGVWLANAEVEVFSSDVWGNTNGLYAMGGDVEIGGGSTVGGGDDEEGTGIGVYVSNAFLRVTQSQIASEGDVALDGYASAYLAVGAGFTAENKGSAMRLTDASPLTYFDKCTFMAYETNATADAVIVLDGVGTNTPTPELFGCVIRGLGAQDSIDTGPSASSASVRMINSTLSANVATNITLLAPDVILSNGNHIVSTPVSWWVLFGQD